MARAGPLRGLWRRRVATSEVMKWISLILPGLGPPVQILPHQQAPDLSSASTSCSTILSSHFQPCRRVRQHSSHTIRPIRRSESLRHQRQRVLLLENDLQTGSFCGKHFLSCLHGDARALKPQRPWSKEKFKDAFNLNSTGEPKKTVDVQSFNRPFEESHRPTGNYPSLVTQLPTALEPQFPSASVDQSRTRDLNAPGNLDPSTSSSTPQVVQPGSKASSKPEPAVSTISEHRRSRRAEKSRSDLRAPSPNNRRPGPRVETSYMLGEQPLTRSSNKIASSNPNPNFSKQIVAGVDSKKVISNQTVRRSPEGGAHLISNSHATRKAYRKSRRKSRTRVEPPYVVVDQARSSQNGTQPAVNDYRVPASRIVGSVIRQTSGVAKLYSQSLQRVQQELDTFRGQGRLQKMAAELCGREAQYRGEAEALAGFQGVRGHGNNLAHLEAPSPQTRPEAGKWREAANLIEQNRNPSHKVVGGIEPRQQNTDSLKVEVERESELKANLTRSLAANDVLEIREPEPLSREEEGQTSAISEKRVTENSVRQDVITEELLRKAHWMDGRSTPAGMKAGLNLIGQGGLHPRASCGSRDWCRDSAQGNGITGMHSAGTLSQAIAVLQNCLQRGITTDWYTSVQILQMCSKQKDLLAAKHVHDCIIQSGMDKNLYVAVTLLNVYIKCGALLDARRVFDQLEKKSVVTWTNMIAGYAKSDHAESALELFNQMLQEGVEPNEITYLSILNACANPLLLKWGKKIHECIRHAGFESDVRVGTALLQMYAKSSSIDDARLVFDKMEKRDVVAWNVVIGAYADSGRGVEAYQLFLQMRREGFEPNAFTYASILNASGSAGALEWVKEVHGHISKAGLESDLRVGTALVHMYSESGSIDDARRVFDRMEKHDVVTWNVMIGGLAQHGCGNEALEVFRKMNADGVKPDRTSFVSVLYACSHGGLVDDGRRLFLAMTQDYGIEPDIVHYTCMVDLLGRAGHLEEAKLFISDMPVEPSAVTWSALLGACRTYANVELGELAAKELFKLDSNNDYAYVLLSNIYAAAGNWEKVSLVRSIMQKRGVRKVPGRSWIEVDNKIHEFGVGDTSHPEAKAIHTYIQKLTEKLKAEGYIPDTRLVLHDINEEDKELALCSHSEKLAIAYGLIHIPQKEPIRVTKNLRVCPDCHTATKFISKVTGREIIARDANRFHHFKDGVCSCGDYW